VGNRLFSSRWGPIHAELWWAATHAVGARKCPCGRWFLLAGPRGSRADYCHACRDAHAAQKAYRERIKGTRRFLLAEERRRRLAMVRRGTLTVRDFNRWAVEHDQDGVNPKRYRR